PAVPTVSLQSPSPGDQSATRIDITQHGDPHDAWDKATGLIQNLAWPLTLAIALYAFRGSIRKIIEQMGSSGGEISYAVFCLKKKKAERSSLVYDVLLFQAGYPVTIANDSAKTTLLKKIRERGNHEYVVINLGNGNQ